MGAEHRIVPDLRAGPELSDAVAAAAAIGGHVFAVGGTVRDACLGLPLVEWDLATDLNPDQVQRVLGAGRQVTVEQQLGAVSTRLDGKDAVWTTLREEADYGPDRRPHTVRFVRDVAKDAVRRDFTMNAMYLELPSGPWLDPCGGADDLRASRLRVVGDPGTRLAEDPLRVLRGVRFAARFGLVIDAVTRRGMRNAASRCASLSAERVRGELERSLAAEGRGRAATLLTQLGVVPAILPELAARSAECWQSTASRLEALDPPTPATMWAALFDDRELAIAALERLHAPRPTQRAAVALLDVADAIRRWDTLPAERRLEVLARAGDQGTLGYLRAVASAQGLPESKIETVASSWQSARDGAARPLVRGTDVLAAGVPRGPDVANILAAVRAAVFRGEIGDRDGALALVGRLAAERVKAPPRSDDSSSEHGPSTDPPMNPETNEDFEEYRRDRKRRQFAEGSHRQLGDHEEVVRALEEVEAREVNDQRLTREVQDFFVDATRTAAQIVSQVSESAEREQAIQVAQEMSDFLNSTLSRAQQFVMLMQTKTNPNVAQSDVQANMHNLVGPALDGFRHEGNSSASTMHIGLDPFAVDLEEMAPSEVRREPPRPAPGFLKATPEEPRRPIEDHLVAEVLEADQADTADPVDTMADWFRELCDESDRVKAALRALVRAQVMSREVARSVWVGLHTARSEH